MKFQIAVAIKNLILSRLALKIVVMALGKRQEARVKRVWAILLFVTYYSSRSRSASTVFFRSPTYNLEKSNRSKIISSEGTPKQQGTEKTHV